MRAVEKGELVWLTHTHTLRPNAKKKVLALIDSLALDFHFNAATLDDCNGNNQISISIQIN